MAYVSLTTHAIRTNRQASLELTTESDSDEKEHQAANGSEIRARNDGL